MAVRSSFVLLICAFIGLSAHGDTVKTRGILYPRALVDSAIANAAADPRAANVRDGLVAAAKPWMDAPDEVLWDFQFGPNIKRSWMVWSDGFCPACKEDVKMYTWKIDAWKHPWKVQCPHCNELFPKNDFAAYHKSGLNEQGIFVPALADKNLLFNAEHPNADDPLRTFGVDDGEGYVDAEDHRWRFTGCYLIYGQWKQLIVDGVAALSDAYMVTGDAKCAHKAFILLDRAADIFPTFEFADQGLVYEGRSGGPVRGQVSTWHDACEEIRRLAESYDKIFDAGQALEADLVPFLSQKAAQHKLPNPKTSWADIQRNIEDNLFRNTLANRKRIESNYPTTDRTILTIKTILGWPDNRGEVIGIWDGILDKATAVDGLSGEKGVAGYTTIAPRTIAELLGKFSRIEPEFLKTVFDRHPRLHAMYRFHMDTWCLGRYYPASGDTGAFAQKCPSYCAVTFGANPGTGPSMYSFFWDLYQVTQDPAFVQVLYSQNGMKTDGLPYDLFTNNASEFQNSVRQVIEKCGPELTLSSVNKEQWRLAVLRSGVGDDRRALWIDYDAGERHSHADAMNIGYFAKGLDLMPDFGYPPVGYGGWQAPKAVWYTKTAAHNTVVVDGADQKRVNSGATTLWAVGRQFHAIAVSDPQLYGIRQYERLVAMVDMDEKDSYIIDCFRVDGGKDHAKYFHSHFGAVQTSGLNLSAVAPFGADVDIENYRCDTGPKPGWYADWTIEDRLEYLPSPKDLHIRYTDLTVGAAACIADAWVDPALFGESGGTHIPCIITRRTGESLKSTFAAVIDPYEGRPNVTQVKRLPLQDAAGANLDEHAVAFELSRKDGRRDVVLIPPPGVPESYEPSNRIRLFGSFALVSFGPRGVERAVICKGSKLLINNDWVKLKHEVGFVEIEFKPDSAGGIAGDVDAIGAITKILAR